MTVAPEPLDRSGGAPGLVERRHGRQGRQAKEDAGVAQAGGKSRRGAAEVAGAPGVPRSVAKDAAATETTDEGAPKKKSKKKLLIVLVLVVLLGGGVFYKKLHKVVYKPGQPVPPGKVFSLGTLTVNTSDGHYVQVGIDLQLTKPANSKQLKTEQPQLLNAAIADLGQQTYSGLLAPTGRTALLNELLTSFQQVLGPVDGAAQQVSAVYFTSFVLQ